MMIKKLLLVGCLFYSTVLFADIIKLRADSWCPVNCAPSTEHPGYMIEIAKAIFEKEGHKIDYQIMPWPAAIAETRAGKYNGIVGAAQSDAPDFVFPDNEQGISIFEFWAKKTSNWQYQNINSLSQIVLGVISGYSYGDPLDGYINANKNNHTKISLVSGDNAAIKNINKLLDNLISAFVEDHMVATYYLDKIHKTNEVKIVGQLSPENMYIAFSPKNPNSARYAKMLSDGMDKLRASGELNQILSHYGLTDWKK